MPALYRDYRPKSFSEVIGQDHIKQTLRNAVAQGSFSHAYLFTGPRGTGKTSVARIFARAINCLHQKNGEPDNSCEICRQFLEGKSLDLIEIDAASNTGVENIREIIEHLKFSPTQAKFKVFIIDEVHMLSKGAFNALLKTLEEPPAHAVFILATTEVHKVPATVVSRTQRFDFHKLDSAKLFEHLKFVAKLEKIKVDDQVLQLIVAASEGGARDALSILDKLSTFGEVGLEQAEKILGITNVFAAQQLLDLLVSKNAQGALEYLEQMFSSGVDPIQFNKDFLEYLRKVLMMSSGVELKFALDQQHLAALKNHAATIPQNQLLYVIRLFLRANKDFETAPSPELPIEIAAAEGSFEPSASSANQKIAAKFQDADKDQLKKKPEKIEFQVQRSEQSAQPQQEITETVSNVAVDNSTTLSELLESWPELLKFIKQQHGYLLAIVRASRLAAVENGTLVLAVTTKFNKDSLEILKNKKILSEALQKIYGKQLEIEIRLEKPGNTDLSEGSDAAMEVFGGELV